ncbi:MAG TPA: polysaccharide deacetylase family protein [Vicinamibacterales bacterium]|nr:polysaccharide deacetylase family protein [Vicinamibacterales bacterium]
MFWLVAALGIGVIALAHTAPFPFLLEYAGPGRSVWHVPRTDGAPTIYLTYDDGPNPEATPDLLDVLTREAVPATFFVIPKHVNESTAPIIRRALENGHGVALHSHTRALLLKKPHELERLLADQAADIERLAGGRPCQLFRPHAGWRGGQLYAGLDRGGYALAGWSFGMWDWNWWRPSRPEKLAARLAARASDGDIVVMHDGHHDNPRADRKRTIAATADLIPLLKKKGFRFGSLCQAVGDHLRRAAMNERIPITR